MTRYCTRPLTEQDLDERANLLSVYSHSPVWRNQMPEPEDRDSRLTRAFLDATEWAQSSSGCGCMESGAMPEMACFAPAETEDKQQSFWAEFWSWLKAPKPDFKV